ncbi:MAG TPA: hypothetical protein VGR37_01230, partial [Longimicrobiaceae bacterium]|nr:hypothetical protein [Longimicrobiaceae bacterium]
PGGKRLNGVYLRVKTASDIWGRGLVREYLTLFPDGRYYAGGYPEEGMHGFDWSYWCGRKDRSCGTYEVESRSGDRLDRVRTRSTSGETKEYQVAREQGQSAISAFDRLDRLDGLRLGSRYQADCHNGYTGSIEFTRDGRFTEREFLGCVGWLHIRGHHIDSPEEYAARKRVLEQRPAGSGTYSIQANTLELRYSDGRNIRLGMHATADPARNADPAEICPREQCLKRVP